MELLLISDVVELRHLSSAKCHLIKSHTAGRYWLKPFKLQPGITTCRTSKDNQSFRPDREFQNWPITVRVYSRKKTSDRSITRPLYCGRCPLSSRVIIDSHRVLSSWEASGGLEPSHTSDVNHECFNVIRTNHRVVWSSRWSSTWYNNHTFKP